jgi:hypothetical protein
VNSAWDRNLALSQSSRWRYKLTPREQHLLKEACLKFPDVSYEEVNEAYLPTFFQERLLEIRSDLKTGLGLYLIESLPLDELSVPAVRKLYFAIGCALGTPVYQDPRGSRIVDIRATDASIEAAIHYKAKKDGSHFRPYETNLAFSYHTDPCDVAGLICLQNAAQGGETQVASALHLRDLLQREDPTLVDALSTPFPYAKPEIPGKSLEYYLIPVFSEQAGYFKSHVVPDLVWLGQRRDGIPKLTEVQVLALRRLEALARQPENHVAFTLRTGDLLLVNNHIVYHARSAYEDSESFTRFLMRLWLSVPNSRPLSPVHAEWFGDPRAGAIRGGYLKSSWNRG